MKSMEKLMEFCRKYLENEPRAIQELLLIFEECDTEARKDIVAYARERDLLK